MGKIDLSAAATAWLNAEKNKPKTGNKTNVTTTVAPNTANQTAYREMTASELLADVKNGAQRPEVKTWIANRKSELQQQISTYESTLAKLRTAPTVPAKLQSELNSVGVSGITPFNPLGGVTAKAKEYGAAKAKQDGIAELEQELRNLRYDLQELEDPVKAELMAMGAIKEEDQRAHRKLEIQRQTDGQQNAGYIGTNFVGGLTDVVGGFYNAADAIIPDRNAAGERINTPRIDAFQKAKENLEADVSAYGAEVSPAMQKYGGMIARGVGYTLPSSVLAMLPGVQALSASAGSNVLANPQFWFSAIPMYGNGYQQAKEEGATEQEAQWFAALNALAGAAVEIGGGVQKIPTEEKTLLTWIRGALDEGKEEVLQGIIEGLASKVTYDENKKIASWDDPDAIISGKRALQEFGSGAMMGGILGGGQVLAGAVVDAETAAEMYEKAPKDQEFLSFYDDVLSMKDQSVISKRKKKIGMLSANNAAIVEQLFKYELGEDINLEGYELWIDGSGIKHIENRHGENGEANSTMANRDDIAKVPWVVNNAQFGEVLRDEKGNYIRDSVWQNRDQSKAYQVRVGVNIGDGIFYVVECVPDSAQKRVYIKSAYKKSGKGQLLNLIFKKTRQLTPKALVGGNATNTTVAQNAGGVNTYSMQNGGVNTQSAYLPEDQFVDRMGETPSVTADGGATRLAGDGPLLSASGHFPRNAGESTLGEGGYESGGAVQVDEGAVLERAVRSQLQGKTVAQGRDIDSIAAEIGEDEMLRRMYNATQMDRPTGNVTINGQTVPAMAYVDAYEADLPDDPAALREHIRSLEEQRTAAILQMEQEGTLEDYTRGGLKIDLQLFAANRKWEMLQLDPGEEGKKARQFYEKRLRGTDANHHDELIELLAGRSETYNPISAQKQLDLANNRLRSDAKYQQKLIKRIGRYNPRDMFSPVDVAAAQLLINDALNNGEYEVAANLIAGLSRKGTELGRAVQAFSIMARLTPEGTLRMAQRTMKAEADYIIGEGASDGLDVLADDIADAIGAAEEQARRGGNTSSTASGPPSPQGEGRAVEDARPYGVPAWDGTVGDGTPSMEGATRKQVVDALVDDLAATEGNYLSRDAIAGIVERAIDQAANVPEQVKRYVLKKIRKNDGGLAQRLYEMHQKGHLTADKTRRAMEQVLELPTLSTEDIQTVVEMGTRIQQLQDDPIAQADAMDELYDFLAAKMSVNGWDKLQAWRKFGMLANVKTHIRNIVSNGAYSGIRKADDAVAMVIERIFNVDPEKRAAMLGWRHTKHGQSIMPVLQEQAKLAVLEMQKRGAKYETGSGQLKQRRKFFGESKVGEVLNDANSRNSDWLEREDIWFFRPAYIDALGQMMTARGTTEITNEMHEKAMQRALEATFRADNAMSEVVGSLKRFQNSDKVGLRLFGNAVDIIVPFHKTPANIAAQTVMHSPIGIVKGCFELYNATKGKGTVEVADAINSFAKGITGSALLAIGLLLGKAGLFNTGFGKTEKERAADELAGRQENALMIGDLSISLDWLQPAASPLIVGASIGKRLADDDISLSAVFGAVMDGTDSLFEMTMLQSLYDILGGYDAGATATAASVVENAVSQSIPTLLGQAARAIDPVQRKTTGDSDFETLLNQVLAKIPGLTYLLDPELDVWGNEVYRTGKPGGGNAAWNAVQQFVSPANVKVGTGSGDRVSAEILRLYDKHGSKAIPTAVSRDDARDGGLDYVDINRLLGYVNRQAVEDFINNDWPYAVQVDAGNGKTKKVTKYYRNMTDEERVRVLQRIYTNTKKTVTKSDEEKDSTDSYFEDIFRRLQ